MYNIILLKKKHTFFEYHNPKYVNSIFFFVSRLRSTYINFYLSFNIFLFAYNFFSIIFLKYHSTILFFKIFFFHRQIIIFVYHQSFHFIYNMYVYIYNMSILKFDKNYRKLIILLLFKKKNGVFLSKK